MCSSAPRGFPAPPRRGEQIQGPLLQPRHRRPPAPRLPRSSAAAPCVPGAAPIGPAAPEEGFTSGLRHTWAALPFRHQGVLHLPRTQRRDMKPFTIDLLILCDVSLQEPGVVLSPVHVCPTGAGIRHLLPVFFSNTSHHILHTIYGSSCLGT